MASPTDAGAVIEGIVTVDRRSALRDPPGFGQAQESVGHRCDAFLA